VKQYMSALGRADEYKPMAPAEGAYYDEVITVELDKVEPMIALPFHPSNAYTIADFKANLMDILHETDEATIRQFKLKKAPKSLTEKVRDGRFYVDQAVIAGCSGGTYQNLMRVTEMLRGKALGDEALWLSCYPGSMPAFLALSRNGAISELLAAGVSVRSCFCGPCFGAGDVPANGAFSIRHSTRNFPNREGSKPADGQLSYVALMDARSITATVLNGGALTAATELENLPADPACEPYDYDESAYRSRVYCGVGHPKPETELVFGPNISDWPEQIALPEDLLLTAASAIYDPVTTTDELIPSGDTSSYRSNPLKLSEFALSRKDPAYVGRAKAIQAVEAKRRRGEMDEEVTAELGGHDAAKTGLGSFVMALKPGDGSAREQAASCQRVLGGVANLAAEYATKRYRSNVVNWGMLPFIAEDVEQWNIQPGDRLYIPGVKALLEGDGESISAVLMQNGEERSVTLTLPAMTREERDIVLAGCLINYYKG
jgi:aconitate hydratase